jgi:hypothetical protein
MHQMLGLHARTATTSWNPYRNNVEQSKAHVTMHKTEGISLHAKAPSDMIGPTICNKMGVKQATTTCSTFLLGLKPALGSHQYNINKNAVPARPCHHHRRWSVWADVSSSMSKEEHTVSDL